MAGTLDLGKVVGENGQGVPSGGSTGTILRKRSGSDYDTEWGVYKPVLLVDCGVIDALPVTIANANIKYDMVVVGYEFGAPDAFVSRLIVNTGPGSVELSGTISGASTVKLWLASSV